MNNKYLSLTSKPIPEKWKMQLIADINEPWDDFRDRVRVKLWKTDDGYKIDHAYNSGSPVWKTVYSTTLQDIVDKIPQPESIVLVYDRPFKDYIEKHGIPFIQRVRFP
jgi:hypothetical protein